MTIDEYNKHPNKCLNCNTIIVFNSRKRIRNRQYCCLKCANDYLSIKRNKIALEKYSINPFYCGWCNTIIPSEKRNTKKCEMKFCDNFCAAKYRSKYFPLSKDTLKKI